MKKGVNGVTHGACHLHFARDLRGPKNKISKVRGLLFVLNNVSVNGLLRTFALGDGAHTGPHLTQCSVFFKSQPLEHVLCKVTIYQILRMM